MEFQLSDEQTKLFAAVYLQPVSDGQKMNVIFYTAGGVGTMAQHTGLPGGQVVWELMRFADEPAECPFTRQITRSIDGEFGLVNGPTRDSVFSSEPDSFAEDD